MRYRRRSCVRQLGWGVVLVVCCFGCLGSVIQNGNTEFPEAPPAPSITTKYPSTMWTPAPAQTIQTQLPVPPPPGDSLSAQVDEYYSNCAEARQAGVAPIHRGDPGYRKGLDRDGDGVACG